MNDVLSDFFNKLPRRKRKNIKFEQNTNFFGCNPYYDSIMEDDGFGSLRLFNNSYFDSEMPDCYKELMDFSSDEYVNYCKNKHSYLRHQEGIEKVKNLIEDETSESIQNIEYWNTTPSKRKKRILGEIDLLVNDINTHRKNPKKRNNLLIHELKSTLYPNLIYYGLVQLNNHRHILRDLYKCKMDYFLDIYNVETDWSGFWDIVYNDDELSFLYEIKPDEDPQETDSKRNSFVLPIPEKILSKVECKL